MHTEVLKADPLSPRSPLSCSIDMAVLRTMDVEQLGSLRDAIHTLGNVVSGLYCQPRFCTFDDDPEQLAPDDNAAGKSLCALNEWLSGYEEAIVNVVKAYTTSNNREVAQRTRILLAYEAACDDDLAEFSKIVSGALDRLAAPEALQ